MWAMRAHDDEIFLWTDLIFDYRSQVLVNLKCWDPHILVVRLRRKFTKYAWNWLTARTIWGCPHVCQMTHYREGELNQSAVGNKGLFREVDGWGGRRWWGWLQRGFKDKFELQIRVFLLEIILKSTPDCVSS